MNAVVTNSDGAESVIVQMQRDGQIAQVRFNRPTRLNAIDLELASQFQQACELIVADQNVRVLC